MTLNSNVVPRAIALLACVWFISAYAHAATVSFQQRNYAVSIVPLANTVPASTGADLIFVILPNNQKYLCIPTDPAVRAVFDPSVQRFYRVDRAAGLINGFSALNSTLINVDGTFFASKTDTPQLSGTQSTLESYGIPLSVDTTLTADIAVLDSGTLAYRTSTTTIFEISRTNPSTVFNNGGNGVAIPIKVPPPLNVAIDFDAENGTNLLLQTGATDANNVALSDRISAYFRGSPALLFDQIILANNPAIPGYTGNASGIAYDVDTSDIYVLDGRQLIVFKVQRPSLSAVTPNQGPVSGATTVSITGANIPSDAIVFFDGIQASNILVKSTSQITCNPPPHALGTVNVTMTGTGIIPGSPVTLTGAYTYVNFPPTAVLSASPSQGATPLSVLFGVGGSSSPFGTLTKRVIDFGDGTSFTFPSDLTATTTSHTYTGNGTFTAILTVTDDQGATATNSTIIIVGTGGEDVTDGVLILRTLAMKVQYPPKSPPGNTDRITMTGQILLPLGVTPTALSGGQLVLAINGVPIGAANKTLNSSGQIKLTTEKFTLKLVKSPGTPSGTYTFTYALTKANLYAAIPMFTPPTVIPNRFSEPVSLTLFTPLGRMLAFGKNPEKLAVVNARQSKVGANLSLVRK